jgi:hypothetical protein
MSQRIRRIGKARCERFEAVNLAGHSSLLCH